MDDTAQPMRMRAGSMLPIAALTAAMGGATVLGSLAMPTFRDEADVMRFALLGYLPFVAGAGVFAMALARRLNHDDPWIASKAAAVYAVPMITVGSGLSPLSHAGPIAASIVVLAAFADALAQAGPPRRWEAPALAMAVFGAYVPHLNETLAGAEIGLVEMAVGLALAAALSRAALRCVDPRLPTLPDSHHSVFRSSLAVLGSVEAAPEGIWQRRR